jgi:hypothetical protein
MLSIPVGALNAIVFKVTEGVEPEGFGEEAELPPHPNHKVMSTSSQAEQK